MFAIKQKVEMDLILSYCEHSVRKLYISLLQQERTTNINF